MVVAGYLAFFLPYTKRELGVMKFRFSRKRLYIGLVV